jgi:hypothetical protein
VRERERGREIESERESERERESELKTGIVRGTSIGMIVHKYPDVKML